MTKHTPTPYKVNAIGRRNGQRVILGNESVEEAESYLLCNHNVTVAKVYRPKDIRFIVKACNLHDELVGALRIIHDSLAAYPRIVELDRYLQVAHVALAKARGDDISLDKHETRE